MRRIPALLVFFLAASAYSGEQRQWTSAKGSTISAALVSYAPPAVVLEDGKGKRFQIRDTDLSAADQAYLKEHRAAPAVPAATAASPSPSSYFFGNSNLVAQLTPGTLLTRTTEGENKLTYHVQVPSKFDPQKPPPLLISFDPGGNGQWILGQFKPAAEEMGWLLVGVDTLRNQMNEKSGVEASMEDEVLGDILTNFPYTVNRVYLGGLSGGAARSYALSSRRADLPFAGVLACGGWLGGDYWRKQKYRKHMAVAMVNGDNDKNANCWVEGDSAVLKRYKCHVKLFPFQGGHEVGPANVLTDALKWMEEDWNKGPGKL